ncbi:MULTISPECIES: protein TolR [Uliginosibacterium]|uniref:Protein TolR n=1 Tax=Uliginosibacterium aquaticum TaxID=2731212 RepID=A0ABX2IN57_9RHOO|nr:MULTISPECIES: protein TolR [Uliginosibacterium]NSL55736.1 protein TolR [Uliginosibacterium aquaticum]PLK50510.1 protein TolR [Uliginosibacterium sp. TH139]
MRQRRLMNQINVVPYIDVMLVLLVIFMVTAPMLPTGTVDLPSVAKTSQVKTDPVTLTVKGMDKIDFEDKETQSRFSSVSEDELLEKLRTIQETNPDRAVVIAADKSVRYEAVMKLMDLLQRNNINKVGLLVQPAGK